MVWEKLWGKESGPEVLYAMLFVSEYVAGREHDKEVVRLHFDREALGGGITVYSREENHKVHVELTAYLTAMEKDRFSPEAMRVEFVITDREGRETAAACVPAQDICTAETLLLYPHLWSPGKDAYLYKVTAALIKGGQVIDVLHVFHGIKTFQNRPPKGMYLNGKYFDRRAVRYELPAQMSGRSLYHELLESDMKALAGLGANTVCPVHPVQDPAFYELCDRLGIVVWQEMSEHSSAPMLAGEEADCLIGPGGHRKRDLYYYYKALWTSEPFIHICGRDNYCREGVVTEIHIYSNQKRVALYVDGILFEFKESAPEFVFFDVPLKRGSTIITAQAGECCTSLTLLGEPEAS